MLINKLCQITSHRDGELVYLQTANCEVLVDGLTSEDSLSCEILQFANQEDCDNLRNLVSIRNETIETNQYPIRQYCLEQLRKLPDLENLQ